MTVKAVFENGQTANVRTPLGAAGLPTYSVRGNWGSGFVKGQTFSLIPPGPAMIMSCP
jgi:hypothetical protein